MIVNFAKFLAYHCGAMGAYQSSRNASTLTVIMFHRVLPQDEIVRLGADPLNTATPEFFSACIAFVRRHFAIVGMKQVLRARAGTAPLPKKALLITFDDGWRDNLVYALPILADIPWTIFAATDPLQDEGDCWWQEALDWMLRTGRADFDALRQAADDISSKPLSHGPIENFLSLLELYAVLSPEQRMRILAPYTKENSERAMLTPAELHQMNAGGVDVGGHGAAHLPLTGSTDARADIQRARETLSGWVGVDANDTFAFPHGKYDQATMQTARELGYDLLFSTDAVLNAADGGWIRSDLLGRIPVDMQGLTNTKGELLPDRLAAWLFLREIHPKTENG